MKKLKIIVFSLFLAASTSVAQESVKSQKYSFNWDENKSEISGFKKQDLDLENTRKKSNQGRIKMH